MGESSPPVEYLREESHPSSVSLETSPPRIDYCRQHDISPMVESSMVESPMVESFVAQFPAVQSTMVESPIEGGPMVQSPRIHPPVVQSSMMQSPVPETLVVESQALLPSAPPCG